MRLRSIQCQIRVARSTEFNEVNSGGPQDGNSEVGRALPVWISPPSHLNCFDTALSISRLHKFNRIGVNSNGFGEHGDLKPNMDCFATTW